MTEHKPLGQIGFVSLPVTDELGFGADDSALAEALGALEAPAVFAQGVSAGKARLLAAVTRPAQRYAPFFDKLSELFDLGQEALGKLFERAALPTEWAAGPLPGVRLFHLDGGPRVAEADAGLVRMQAGLTFPVHRHRGDEQVILLEGSYRDSSGRLYEAGDTHVMPTGTQHHFQVSAGRDLLLAVVMTAEIEVLGMP